MLEQKMIALYNTHTKLLFLPGGQYGRIRAVSYVMNDLVATVDILPRMPCETDTIFAVAPTYNDTVRKSDPKNSENRISPEKIRRALVWLIANNPIYAQASRENRIQFERFDLLQNLAVVSESDPTNHASTGHESHHHEFQNHDSHPDEFSLLYSLL